MSTPKKNNREFYRIELAIPTKLRCQYCHVPIDNLQNAIVVLLPNISDGCSYCSVLCLFKYLMRLVRRNIINRKLDKLDLLKVSGIVRKWGDKISKEELNTKIEGW